MTRPSHTSHGLSAIHSLSPAFRTALLQSEATRAKAVICVAAFFLLYVVLRTEGAMDSRLRVTALFGLAALVAIQLIVLAFVQRSRQRGRNLPSVLVVCTVLAEGMIPSIIIFSHVVRGVVPPYAAMVAPPIFLYGVLISLTTLRLVPAMCVLSSAVVAAGQFAILLYVTSRLHIPVPTTGLPREAYFSIPLIILVSGFAAAWVTRELRRNIVAALREADIRRAMDRIAHDLDVARTIQRALLPKASPNIPGFEVAAWNAPADQTGGDYYDWQPLPDGVWMVSVADVCGHGVGPALVTAACRAYVRASSLHHADLGELTTRVNRLLADDLPEGRFVTMVCALLQPRDSSLTLLSAGHGPIALYRHASGQVEDILAKDLPLAILPEASFGPALSFQMQPGDVLALVTDGVVEWARPSSDGKTEQFGLARLRDSIRRHAHLGANDMLHAIVRDVTAFAHPNPQQDDVTILMLRRLPEHAHERQQTKSA